MKLLKGGTNVGMGIAIGVGAAMLIPLAAKVLSGAAKPLIKESIKGGLVVAEKSKVIFAEAMETVEDLAAEAKSEMEAETAKPKAKAPAPAKKTS